MAPLSSDSSPSANTTFSSPQIDGRRHGGGSTSLDCPTRQRFPRCLEVLCYALQGLAKGSPDWISKSAFVNIPCELKPLPRAIALFSHCGLPPGFVDVHATQSLAVGRISLVPPFNINMPLLLKPPSKHAAHFPCPDRIPERCIAHCTVETHGIGRSPCIDVAQPQLLGQVHQNSSFDAS
ncbi:hypothetical protein BKA56DRAFT_665211 [Ilyonectria sp. MPI-CAGE-AT-0026]|nr:hypothetical protein BKA56DRAFT_665211 [Ilyonectria sp. MPI-CAGE-AT-0026]